MDSIITIIGKLHPLILHLPIGILMLAFLMEWRDRKAKQKRFKEAIQFSLSLGMIGAVLAAFSGYLLSLNGGYDEIILYRHKWLGIGVAVLSIFLYVIHQKQESAIGKYYFPAFIIMLIVLTGAGHYGGSMTHGSDFLSFNSENEANQEPINDLENALAYKDIIRPILKEKCMGCHNKSKIKGDLLMTSIEGMKKGGKTGTLFDENDVANSLFLKRIHLPKSEKKHMPPKGKKQLLGDEIKLLNWWITEGFNFTAKVNELKKDEKTQILLNKFTAPKDALQSVQVAKIDEKTLQKIRKSGIPIFRIGENSSFLEVDLARKKGVNKNLLKKLKPVSKQLVSLNLSNTDVKDTDLSILSEFPHLQKLFLQGTNFTDKGLQHLKNPEYLEYLNLYQTKITNEGLKAISQFKRLKKLFLWQTNTTEEGIVKFVNEKPKTLINRGTDINIFGDARLKPPLIIAEKDLFQDSLRVALKMNFSNVIFYYTLDGSTPDSNSSLYATPILLDKTTNIKAIAVKEGWKSSEPAKKQFVRVKYVPKMVSLDKKPSDRYKANGPKSLIDLKKGSIIFTDGNWLGYEKEHFTATLDLGKIQVISGLSIGTLESPGSYIFFPKRIKVTASIDGKTYKEVLSKKYPTATENKPTIVTNLSESFDKQNARFVRVKIESNLVNPDWHPAPGAPCWLFIDEISVE